MNGPTSNDFAGHENTGMPHQLFQQLRANATPRSDGLGRLNQGPNLRSTQNVSGLFSQAPLYNLEEAVIQQLNSTIPGDTRQREPIGANLDEVLEYSNKVFGRFGTVIELDKTGRCLKVINKFESIGLQYLPPEKGLETELLHRYYMAILTELIVDPQMGLCLLNNFSAKMDVISNLDPASRKEPTFDDSVISAANFNLVSCKGSDRLNELDILLGRTVYELRGEIVGNARCYVHLNSELDCAVVIEGANSSLAKFETPANLNVEQKRELLFSRLNCLTDKSQNQSLNDSIGHLILNPLVPTANRFSLVKGVKIHRSRHEVPVDFLDLSYSTLSDCTLGSFKFSQGSLVMNNVVFRSVRFEDFAAPGIQLRQSRFLNGCVMSHGFDVSGGSLDRTDFTDTKFERSCHPKFIDISATDLTFDTTRKMDEHVDRLYRLARRPYWQQWLVANLLLGGQLNLHHQMKVVADRASVKLWPGGFKYRVTGKPDETGRNMGFIGFMKVLEGRGV